MRGGRWKMIDGNTIAQIQRKKVTTGIIGEQITEWENVDTISGYLDLATGNSKYTEQNVKTQESTHIFIAEYKHINITAQDGRLVINNQPYDIMYIDDVMGLHQHYEIYLKYVDGDKNVSNV